MKYIRWLKLLKWLKEKLIDIYAFWRISDIVTAIIYIGVLFLANYLVFRLDSRFPRLALFSYKRTGFYLALSLGLSCLLMMVPVSSLGTDKLYLFLLYAFIFVYWSPLISLAVGGLMLVAAYFGMGGEPWSETFLWQTSLLFIAYFLLLSLTGSRLKDFHKLLFLGFVASLSAASSSLFSRGGIVAFVLIFLFLGAQSLVSSSVLQFLMEDLLRVRHLIDRDVLTGVQNLGKFNRDLKDLASRRKKVTVVLVDIDFFKSYNDQLGHEAGDIVLKSVAQRLRIYFDSDQSSIYRIGGDEFALLIEDADLSKTESQLNRMSESIVQQSILYGRDPIKVSLSIGAAASLDDEEPSLTVKRADRALYQAKENGRGCVQIA